LDNSAIDDNVSSLLWLDNSSLWWLVQQSGVAWWDKAMQIPLWEWFAISICLLFSAIYSSSETALTALSQTKIRQLIDSQPEKYRLLELWLENPNRILTTILVGNNLVNILASALATNIATKIFQNQGIAIAVGVMTLLILISGEVAPKTYAKYHAQHVSIRVLPILRLTYLLFLPFIWALVHISAAMVRIFGGKLKHNGPFVTEADIEYMIDLGTREGVLNEEKEKLLQSILEFDDITIREVMIPRTDMLALSLESTPEQVLELAHNSPHSRIPVYEQHLDNIVGILYLRDLFRMYAANGDSQISTRLNELLRHVYFVPGTMKISILLGEFQRRKKHIAIVVDEFGGTMGLVTLEDILEEIVGEIHDEFDIDEDRDLTKNDVGHYLADARISLRELEEHLDIEFPEDGDFETLGGFLTAFFGRVPEVGDKTEWKNFGFIVIEANEKTVKKVEISPVNNSENIASELPSRSEQIE
jgi:CBS domain containing-hemolysin-like protein